MAHKVAIILVWGTLFGPVLSNVCTDVGLATIDGFIPHPTYCSMYISCYGGQPYELACPTGYNFNSILAKCDPKYECTCPPIGVVFQPVGGSFNDYTLCIGGAGYRKQCEVGLSFDAGNMKCIPVKN